MNRSELEQNAMDLLSHFPDYYRIIKKALSPKDFHLTKLQVAVLGFLREENSKTLTELCEKFDVSEKKMTKAVLDLADQKLLEINGKKVKPKHTLFSINDYGVEYLDCIRNAYRDVFSECLSALTDEELLAFLSSSEQLHTLLSKMTASFSTGDD
ncbi:MAG: MarR family winged helix-turn-helix transcriptional regulator [Fusicatenibacter sp.]|nr:MarR family winged helix-turn-helix transcriptional regulator [Lachnospiraceae bacterium]MDY2938949.1 MarR family winged helix-turn-helix transcriptional regulator [Fusicatenibacter sp.]